MYFIIGIVVGDDAEFSADGSSLFYDHFPSLGQLGIEVSGPDQVVN
jgi:hypothetical protein